MRVFVLFARPAARLGAALLACACASGCSTTSATTPDGGEIDASPAVLDICDAFTSVGARCPLESPVRCFPECEAGGCFCGPGEGGAVWSCATDLSCVPDCGPLDDGCGGP